MSNRKVQIDGLADAVRRDQEYRSGENRTLCQVVDQ